jgi:hypothetical protein
VKVQNVLILFVHHGMLPGSRECLTKLFKLCHPLKAVAELKNWLFDMYANIAMVDYPFPGRVFCANVTSSFMEEIQTDEDIVKRIVKGVNVFFNYTGYTECFNTEL